MVVEVVLLFGGLYLRCKRCETEAGTPHNPYPYSYAYSYPFSYPFS